MAKLQFPPNFYKPAIFAFKITLLDPQLCPLLQKGPMLRGAKSAILKV